MGRHLLNGKAQTGGFAAKTLGADAQLIDGGQQLLFQLLEKFQSNSEIAGSPRNSFRASLVLNYRG